MLNGVRWHLAWQCPFPAGTGHLSLNRSPFSSACPARGTACQVAPPMMALQPGRGEPGGLASAWGAGETVLREPARVKETSPGACQPCRGTIAVCWAPRAAEAEEPGESSCKGALEHPAVPPWVHPPCRQQPQPWWDVSQWRKGLLMVRSTFIYLLLHNQDLNISKGWTSPGRRKLSSKHTHRERDAQTQILYMHVHFSLPIFFSC